jgi:hypothetical protein
MLHIKFRYKDTFTHGNWRSQCCTMESVEQCIKEYGLDDPDVEYEIISVEEV